MGRRDGFTREDIRAARKYRRPAGGARLTERELKAALMRVGLPDDSERPSILKSLTDAGHDDARRERRERVAREVQTASIRKANGRNQATGEKLGCLATMVPFIAAASIVARALGLSPPEITAPAEYLGGSAAVTAVVDVVPVSEEAPLPDQ